jgi:anthranilate synthase component 1
MHKKINISYTWKKIISDTITPVGVFLNLRDKYPNLVMLESSDYHGEEHNYSYLGFDPVAGMRLDDAGFHIQYPGTGVELVEFGQDGLAGAIGDYLSVFQVDELDLPFIHGGLFGYMAYDAVQYFEDIAFRREQREIPILLYRLFRYVLAFNHFNNELYIIKLLVNGEDGGDDMEDVIQLVRSRPSTSYIMFDTKGGRTSNCTDEVYMNMVEKGIYHCQRGDVFQIVLSRSFEQGFEGDDFNVYRALRSINPSPYLFYFDYGEFRLFGSSPEAQLIVKGDKVTIHPIAGTFRRTGDDKKDAELALELVNDPKENAEHVMLVDLARNDLSRNGREVDVEVYREVQYYSHVIHLVSKVTCLVNEGTNKVKIIGDTFPAGTLSGAPKYRAMQLIDDYEATSRGFYGGAIGHLDFSGDFNHAIMIRTFMSRAGKLRYQAGAGVVVDSKPESELQEVDNKLMALNKAIELARTI